MVIGVVSGVLLGFQPRVSGITVTSTSYVFQIKTACGIWLLSLLISFLVMLVCILISKLNLNKIDTESK